MTARCLMVQGTTSSAGKSLMVTALCRLLLRRGYRVAPFKAQNMSNNSWIAADGGEIGRAQVLQAQACRLEPTVDMNPILLKPEADAGSQVVLRGRPAFRVSARDYYRRKQDLWPVVVDALAAVRATADIVVIEGAGSPAEINLRSSDIVNMRVALHAQAPVLLVADIDRGGVFAHLYGTLALLEPDERALVRGALINRFRGDVDLLRPGNQMFEARSGVPVVGVVPFLDRHDLPDEDSVRVDSVGARRADAVDIAVIRLPRTSNATDFEPLARQPSVRLRWVDSAETLGRPDLVIVPGSKSTVSDLGWLRDRGIGRCITALAASGTPVAGICGGFQMLGQAIHDPDSVESRSATTKGLSLLPVETFFSGQKRTERVEGSVASLPFARGQAIVGYEIHMGHTRVLSPLSPAFELLHGPDGAVAPSGLVWGTYLHGLFDNAHVTAGLIDWLRARRGLDPVAMSPETPLDARIDYLADQVEASTDVERILSWLELPVRA